MEIEKWASVVVSADNLELAGAVHARRQLSFRPRLPALQLPVRPIVLQLGSGARVQLDPFLLLELGLLLKRLRVRLRVRGLRLG